MKEGPLAPEKNPLFSRPDTIPSQYWQALTQKHYEVSFLGFYCKVFVEKRIIEIKDYPIAPDFQTYLVILSYLNAKKVPLGREWVLAKALKGGLHFFDRSHPLTVGEVLKRVKSKDDLLKAFSRLKGKVIPFGDLGYEFEVFEDIFLRYIYYEGDDEFPAELTVNFQKGIEDMLALDVIWAMVNVVNNLLKAFLNG